MSFDASWCSFIHGGNIREAVLYVIIHPGQLYVYNWVCWLVQSGQEIGLTSDYHERSTSPEYKNIENGNRKIFTPDLRFSLVDFPSVLIRLSGTYSVSCFLYIKPKHVQTNWHCSKLFPKLSSIYPGKNDFKVLKKQTQGHQRAGLIH